MRFKLHLKTENSERLLPVNYQYECSSWIYKTIHNGNPAFALWLHEHGYLDGNKQFRLFTFSKLYPEKYRIQGDRLALQSDKVLVYISFYADEAVEPFITGLFKEQEFSLGDRVSRVSFRVGSIEKLPEPGWKETMTFRAESPVVISRKETSRSRHASYLAPDVKEYGDLLISNLKAKYHALTTNRKQNNGLDYAGYNGGMRFMTMGKSRSRLIKIKADTIEETFVKGYLFDFTLTAPAELLRFGYYAGFGEKNSMGFGSCGVVR